MNECLHGVRLFGFLVSLEMSCGGVRLGEDVHMPLGVGFN